MRFGLEPSQDLGLQHILKNGLAVLRGSEPGQDRQHVLDGLLEIVSDANRGSGALQEHSLTFALDERPAFERFSLFVRYLNDAVDNLPARLAEAKSTLERVGVGQDVTAEQVEHVQDLLARLLEALERERSLTPLTTVRDFHYN